LKEQGEQRTNLGHEESKVGGGAGALDQGVAGRAHHKHQGLTRDGDLRRCRHACSCVQEHVCVCARACVRECFSTAVRTYGHAEHMWM